MSEWMTYRQVSERLGLTSVAAAAARARRGNWPKRLQTLGGAVEVLVPATAKVAAHQQEVRDLEPLPEAMAAIPTKPSRATGSRWFEAHPDLGLRVGGRIFLWRVAREAIARGVSLEDAAAIGRLAKERHFSVKL